jgi:hypothetical protein
MKEQVSSIFLVLYTQTIEHLSSFFRKTNIRIHCYFFFCILTFILLGKWNPINSSDVYKENWFHGKISREEVRIYPREYNIYYWVYFPRLNFY